MADRAEPVGKRYFSTTRLEAFSDGVFAIAVTWRHRRHETERFRSTIDRARHRFAHAP